jgi:hypothetical protein
MMKREQGEDGVEHWRVDKRLPVALIFTIVMSVGSAVWYASATSARITVLEKTVETQVALRDDIVQLKEQVRGLARLLERMETVLDRRAAAPPVPKADKGGLQ